MSAPRRKGRDLAAGLILFGGLAVAAALRLATSIAESGWWTLAAASILAPVVGLGVLSVLAAARR